MINRILLIVVLFSVVGCTPSSANLNKIAQESIRENQELRIQAKLLDSQYVGTDKETILTELGEPRNQLKESSPYKLDINCSGKDCEVGSSDEIWFYEFKRKVLSGGEIYSVYVYFKDEKVVRIR